MSGVNDLIAFGFGGWSTVEKVPTWGFGIGEAVAGVSFYDVSIALQRVTDCTITTQRVTDCTITTTG
jgi:hypothetical protein